MEKEKKERSIFGVVDEVLLDPNGNIILPGEEPIVEETKKPIKKTEPVKEKVEDKIEEPKEEVKEEPKEEVKVEEEVVVADSQPEVEAEPIVLATLPEEEKNVFIAKTFAQKMMEADEIIQDRYDELKNYACRFKKLKARISRKFDSVNKGRLQFVKLSVAGKTLKLYLNMDINSTDPKFHCKDMSDKKTYVTVPVLLRVKSGRAVRYAKILIDQCAEFHGLVENKKYEEIDAITLIEEALSAKEEDGAEEVASTDSEE